MCQEFGDWENICQALVGVDAKWHQTYSLLVMPHSKNCGRKFRMGQECKFPEEWKCKYLTA